MRIYNNKLIKLSELENIFGVSRWTLYQWLRKGKMYGLKMGKHYRIPYSEVERLQREMTQKAGL